MSDTPRTDAHASTHVNGALYVTETHVPIAFARQLERELLMNTAEVEMLRGVGCNEDGDGPCGVCIKCLRTEIERLRT